MTWLAPWALAGGALGMLGIVAAHLLSRQRPRALALATARFLPPGMLEATTVQRVPQDRWWMLLRLLIVALLALAVAQPVFTGSKVPTRTVLLLDRTLPVDVQRTAIGTLSESDVVIAFDTLATLQPVSAPVAQASRASLSAALGLLVRVRDSLALDATELRIMAASRFAERSLDPATREVRALLGDAIGTLPVTVAAEPVPARAAVTVRADGDDPIAATALLLGDSAAVAGTVIDRRATIAADDAAVQERGAAVVHWPARVVSGVPALQAITVGGATWIAPLQRDTAGTVPAGAQPIGWWADGTPAVWRDTRSAGCRITVHAALPSAGDHALSLAAQAWLRTLVTSCETEPSASRPAPAWFAPAPARSALNVAQQTLHSGVAPWLAVAAVLLAAVELALRAVKRP
ncbi:MAG: BatA domain-containing protein [Gemmatimonadota bacterium]